MLESDGDVPQPVHIQMHVNGELRELDVEPRALLSDVLRERLGLVGTRVGCEQGVCGACTVVLDGQVARSCTTLAISVHARELTTIEGVAESENGRVVRRALHEAHGLQCGFCSPGIVVSIATALDDGESLDWVLDELLPGHICRCTGYVNIRKAARSLWGAT